MLNKLMIMIKVRISQRMISQVSKKRLKRKKDRTLEIKMRKWWIILKIRFRVLWNMK